MNSEEQRHTSNRCYRSSATVVVVATDVIMCRLPTDIDLQCLKHGRYISEYRQHNSEDHKINQSSTTRPPSTPFSHPAPSSSPSPHSLAVPAGAALHSDGHRIEQVRANRIRVSPGAVSGAVVYLAQQLLCTLTQPSHRLHCERQMHLRRHPSVLLLLLVCLLRGQTAWAQLGVSEVAVRQSACNSHITRPASLHAAGRRRRWHGAKRIKDKKYSGVAAHLGAELMNFAVDTSGGMGSGAARLVRAIGEEDERWSGETWTSTVVERQLLSSVAAAVH